MDEGDRGLRSVGGALRGVRERGLSGEFAQQRGGFGHRPRLPGEVDEAAGPRHAGRETRQIDPTPEKEDGFAVPGAGFEQLSHALAHHRGPVDGAFPGEDEVGGGDPGVELRGLGEDIESEAPGGAEKGLETEAQAAGRTAAGEAVIDPQFAAGDLGELAEAAFGAGQVGGPEAFLGTIDAGGAPRAEEGVADVGGDNEPAGLGGGRGRLEPVEAVEVGPATEFGTLAVEEAPSEGPGEAEPAVVGGAAADPEEAGGGPGPKGALDKSSHAPGIKVEGVEPAGGKQGEPVGLRGFDDGGPVFRGPPPAGPAGTAGGVHGGSGPGAGLEELSEDGPEAVAPVAHREEDGGVAGAGLEPPGGEGPGDGVRGQGSLEFVGHDEDAHGGTQ